MSQFYFSYYIKDDEENGQINRDSTSRGGVLHRLKSGYGYTRLAMSAGLTFLASQYTALLN